MVKLFGKPNIVKEVCDGWCTSKGCLMKDYLRWWTGGKILRRKPRLWCSDDVEEDLKLLGVWGWQKNAEDPEEWMSILGEAKVQVRLLCHLVSNNTIYRKIICVSCLPNSKSMKLLWLLSLKVIIFFNISLLILNISST